jgi:hypothetical protein
MITAIDNNNYIAPLGGGPYQVGNDDHHDCSTVSVQEILVQMRAMLQMQQVTGLKQYSMSASQEAEVFNLASVFEKKGWDEDAKRYDHARSQAIVQTILAVVSTAAVVGIASKMVYNEFKGGSIQKGLDKMKGQLNADVIASPANRPAPRTQAEWENLARGGAQPFTITNLDEHKAALSRAEANFENSKFKADNNLRIASEVNRGSHSIGNGVNNAVYSFEVAEIVKDKARANASAAGLEAAQSQNKQTLSATDSMLHKLETAWKENDDRYRSWIRATAING